MAVGVGNRHFCGHGAPGNQLGGTPSLAGHREEAGSGQEWWEKILIVRPAGSHMSHRTERATWFEYALTADAPDNLKATLEGIATDRFITIGQE